MLYRALTRCEGEREPNGFLSVEAATLSEAAHKVEARLQCEDHRDEIIGLWPGEHEAILERTLIGEHD
jgi:hypothetical protein